MTRVERAVPGCPVNELCNRPRPVTEMLRCRCVCKLVRGRHPLGEATHERGNRLLLRAKLHGLQLVRSALSPRTLVHVDVGLCLTTQEGAALKGGHRICL